MTQLVPVAPTAPTTPTDPEIIRTQNHGCWATEKVRFWGKIYKQVADPDGKSISLERLNSFDIPKGFPRVPNDLFLRILALYQHFCLSLGAPLEVEVLLLRGGEGFKEWKVLVPHQKVDGASVSCITTHSRDLVTGEEYHQFPVPGWVHAGSSHSHNTMGAFFSGTDDQNELPIPGLHFVIGRIQTDSFQIKASIVHRNKRYIVPPEKVIDMDWEEGKQLPFHPEVLQLVKLPARAITNRAEPSDFARSFNHQFELEYENLSPWHRPKFPGRSLGSRAISHPLIEDPFGVADSFQEENLETGDDVSEQMAYLEDALTVLARSATKEQRQEALALIYAYLQD